MKAPEPGKLMTDSEIPVSSHECQFKAKAVDQILKKLGAPRTIKRRASGKEAGVSLKDETYFGTE